MHYIYIFCRWFSFQNKKNTRLFSYNKYGYMCNELFFYYKSFLDINVHVTCSNNKHSKINPSTMAFSITRRWFMYLQCWLVFVSRDEKNDKFDSHFHKTINIRLYVFMLILLNKVLIFGFFFSLCTKTLFGIILSRHLYWENTNVLKKKTWVLEHILNKYGLIVCRHSSYL